MDTPNNGFSGTPECSTETASRSVEPFCMVQWCDRQTDRQTDLAVTLIGR